MRSARRPRRRSSRAAERVDAVSDQGPMPGAAPLLTEHSHMMAMRVALGLFCAFVLAGCASSTGVRVNQSDMISSCLTTIPDRDALLGVALSGGGSRAALFGTAPRSS